MTLQLHKNRGLREDFVEESRELEEIPVRWWMLLDNTSGEVLKQQNIMQECHNSDA